MAPYSSPRAQITKSGLFGQQTLLIVVGPEREPFHIHPAQLANTGFFKIHGDPPTAAEKEQQLQSALSAPDGVESSYTTPPVSVKEETGTCRSPTLEADRRSTVSEATTVIVADYYLTGQIYEAAAFEMIVKWLYNQAPEVPKSRSQCRTLLRAYVLAIQYGIEKLQDIIVDNFRKWHQEYNVSLEDLLWLINRLGDTATSHMTPMVRYYADQIAFEIHSQGYDNFLQNNGLFDTFLTQGDRPIRTLIFEAMTKVSRSENPVDPATGPNKWRVQDRYAMTQPRANVIEMIEIVDD